MKAYDFKTKISRDLFSLTQQSTNDIYYNFDQFSNWKMNCFGVGVNLPLGKCLEGGRWSPLEFLKRPNSPKFLYSLVHLRNPNQKFYIWESIYNWMAPKWSANTKFRAHLEFYPYLVIKIIQEFSMSAEVKIMNDL